MLDFVEYSIPGGLLAPFIHKLFIKKDIKRIFEYRENKYRQIFMMKQNEFIHNEMESLK
jgi:uncharacterized protein YqhQ